MPLSSIVLVLGAMGATSPGTAAALNPTGPTGATTLPGLALELSATAGATFPPGGRFSAAAFWAASPKIPLARGPQRLAADLIATGEAAMLAWTPPPRAVLVEALADSHSLVRLLSGGSAATGTPGATPTDGDVVRRNPKTQQLETQWALLWSRLDPWVNNSVPHPILVLDNVPFAFCKPGVCTGAAKYGNDYGPNNVTEYSGWIEEVLRGIVRRYGPERAATFWFRVGTEPNTQPGHWNDTNAKYVAEYTAVSAKVVEVIPGAKVGLANFGADGNAVGWDEHVFPMVKGIVDTKAQVDFIALSCYGRGKPGCLPGDPKLGSCRYTVTTAALCANRMARLRAMGGPAWAKLPSQVMEYGLQQNSLNIVDDTPGVFGAAWMLSTSLAHARTGTERAFHWNYGEDGFSHDDAACSTTVSSSKCSLYYGTAWVQAQAGHLFGNATATMLTALRPGSNTSIAKGEEGTSVDGIGGWTAAGELGLLVTAFSPFRKTTDGTPVTVQVSFDRPSAWALAPTRGDEKLELRTATLNRTTSTFDAIYVEAKAKGWLTDPTDPNVYPIGHSVMHMLTVAGKAALVSESGPAYLQMQRQTFAPTDWGDAADSVTCTPAGTCTVSISMPPPAVMAVWVRRPPA